ncbi:MAG TPA: AAA family ATPase, partial [Ochrobactrum sp.]|nr:AAA family ATPase [Ochrobactrum sp.]
MRLVSFLAKGYRSLRSVRFELGQVTVFVGENGAGKSNLYRALQLVKAAAEGTFSTEIVREGGMQSAMWGGVRRKHEQARIILEAEFEDERLASRLSYRVEAGLPPPVSGAFPFEPQIKEEQLNL